MHASTIKSSVAALGCVDKTHRLIIHGDDSIIDAFGRVTWRRIPAHS